MAEDDRTESTEDDLNASYKPDVGTLGGDDADFARALGFGASDEPESSAGTEGERTPPASAKASEAPEPPAANDDQAAEPEAAEVEAEADDPAEPELTAEADDPAEPEVTAEADDPAEPELTAEADVPAEPEVAAEADDPAEPEVAAEADAEVAASPTSPEPEADAATAIPADERVNEPDTPSTFEEIAPRPAAQGMQDTLIERADALLARDEAALPHESNPSGETVSVVAAAHPARVRSEADPNADAAGQARALATALAELEDTRADLLATQARLAALPDPAEADHKELEEARVELETTVIERDALFDQLASANGQLVQARSNADRLETALKAARGALIPLPEGERALRAEVTGLRQRLEEAAQENVRLTGEVANVATELSIALARVQDRQHEIDYHLDRVRELEQEVVETNDQLEQAVGRHREATGLATRVQSENNELRSTQAALEETLQARDLEITAREEHLRVTREGLSARDAQLIDLSQQLDAERREREAVQAALERLEVERQTLGDKVDRRDTRIASLTETLGRVEAALGHRLQLDLTSPPSSSADATRWATPAAPSAFDSSRNGDEAVASAPRPDVTPANGPATETEREDKPASSTDGDSEPGPEPDVAAPATAEIRAALDTEPAAAIQGEVASLDGPATARESRLPLIAEPFLLPHALRAWRDRALARLGGANGQTVDDFLVAQMLQSDLGAPVPEALSLRSLGGSLPDAESRIVSALLAQGVERIRMDVLDAEQELADARRRCVESAGLRGAIEVRVGSPSEWGVEAPCHGLLLADAFHSRPEPDAILDQLTPTIESGALLLFAGRIGTGPIELSTSTLTRLDELWRFLPDSLETLEGLAPPPFPGDSGGWTAQTVDPGRALLERFSPISLAGFGHLSDVLVGPSRGFALPENDPEALAFLDSILALDERRIAAEALPARHGVGAFVHGDLDPPEILGLRWPGLDRD